MVGQDFIMNRGGVLHGDGPVANLLASTRCDPGLSRPYFGEDGHRYVTINTGRKKRVEVRDKRTGVLKTVRSEPIFEQVRITDLINAGVQVPSLTQNSTTLRRDEWLMYDMATRMPQRNRLRAYNDIAAVETFTFPGLGVKILEHETMSEAGRAYQDMDGLSEGTDDTPLFRDEGQPIPITHCNFTLDLRTLESSRRSGMPLSTRGVSWATRRCMEVVEANTIGTPTSPLQYGKNTHTSAYRRTPGVYGLINFPDRIVKTDLTVPTGSNPEAVLQDVLEMRELLTAANFYGPYGIYHSTDYDIFMDNDYARLGGSNANMTLRQRILDIGTEGGDGANDGKQIKWVKRLDNLTPANSHAFTMVMVSLNSDSIRALNGMPVTVFQYETKGGWQMHFRVACIQLIEMFADYYGNCGVLHARSA